MGKTILTGDHPTGRFHVGRHVGSLKRRVGLQNSGEFDEIYIMIADAQALTDNANNPGKVRQNVIEVALDYLACGLGPSKSVLLVQSQVPELCEMTLYHMGLVTVSRLQHNPTVKSEARMRNFEANILVGLFAYPISQAADITAFRVATVPVGEDQVPMIEQTREIVYEFSTVYRGNLVGPNILFPNNKTCLRFPGVDGKAKMSKSLGNCTCLAGSRAGAGEKIMSMLIDPNHLRVEGPSQVEGSPMSVYLDAFCRDKHFAEYLPGYKNLDELKAHCMRGGLGDVKVKRFLNNVLQDELRPIRECRKGFVRNISAIYRTLGEGSRKA